MKIKYGDSGFSVNNHMGFFHLGGSREKIYELEVRSQYRSEHDPERPPGWRPGNGYILLGTIAGLIIGGILGSYGNVLIFLLSIIGGGILGTLMGSLLRKFIKK